MPSETCNRIRVERYFLEEAGGEEKTATGLHIEGCERCKEQLDSLTRERQAYLAVRPFAGFAARNLERPAASARFLPGLQGPPGRRWLPALAGAMACLALVVVMRMPGIPGIQGGSAQGAEAAAASSDAAAASGGTDRAERVAYKGGESLDFLYRRAGKLSPGSLKEVYRAGDELQFTYSSGTHAYVTLASLDGQGKVSLYRKEGEASASLKAVPGKVEPFPFSVTLDAALSGELFVAVFSDAAVSDVVLEAWLDGLFRASGGDLAAVEARLLGKPEAPQPVAVVKPLLLRKAST